MGVPSINLSYTLKGEDILKHLGLPDYAASLEEFIDSSDILKPKITSILSNLPRERKYVEEAVQMAIKENETILKEIFEK
jgi:polysaccharide pyruvyl transferase WcaK-like protein